MLLTMPDYSIFENLTFDRFRELAKDNNLSEHEKVGFPDSYRKGRESAIFNDISGKLSLHSSTGKTVLDIGPGCSRLPRLIMDVCREQGHHLILVDSSEMLSHLPDEPFTKKYVGRYPEISGLMETYSGQVDIILAYSVIQYVFAEASVWRFLDCSLKLLRDGGRFLIGDIPNISMRKRFFASPAGMRCHQDFTGRNENPVVNFNCLDSGCMDDSVVFALAARARASGFQAWIMPQADDLPMANRREDILIRKP